MIQRLQSIFLFLSAVCFGGEFAAPLATSSASVQGIFADQSYQLDDHIALMILAGLGAVLSLVTIFLYNNRKLQLKLSYLITTLAIILPIIAVLLYSNQVGTIPDSVEVNDSLGLYLPIGMILFSILAARFIRKDDNLVKSMDRLR